MDNGDLDKIIKATADGLASLSQRVRNIEKQLFHRPPGTYCFYPFSPEPILNTSWDGDLYTPGVYTTDLVDDWGLPEGIKAVSIRLTARWASASVIFHVTLGPYNSTTGCTMISPTSILAQTNEVPPAQNDPNYTHPENYVQDNCIIIVNENKIDVQVSNSDANVWIQIWGYWI